MHLAQVERPNRPPMVVGQVQPQLQPGRLYQLQVVAAPMPLRDAVALAPVSRYVRRRREILQLAVMHAAQPDQGHANMIRLLLRNNQDPDREGERELRRQVERIMGRLDGGGGGNAQGHHQ